MVTENQKRRALRREQVAAEQAERQRQREERAKACGPRRFFTAKARRGDALTISFEFSGIPVPFNGTDPTEDLLVQTALQKRLQDQAGGTTN